jgi:hypothetical protein
VFYDVSGTSVEVLAIVAKLEAGSWLAQFGNPEWRKFPLSEKDRRFEPFASRQRLPEGSICAVYEGTIQITQVENLKRSAAPPLMYARGTAIVPHPR